MPIRRLLNYIGWPTATGMLMAALAIVLFPQILRPYSEDGGNHFSLSGLSPNSDSWEGPVSYATAVQRATPAVVNIYTRTKLKRRRHPLFDDPLFRHFFNNSDLPQQERMQQALGSGVILPASAARPLFEGDGAKLIGLAEAGSVERSPFGEKHPVD